MAIKRDFENDQVEAARSVMLELMELLKPYQKHIVLIGGSVPRVMFPTASEAHVGTTDVDLAIDRETVENADLEKIETILTQNHYRQSSDKSFIYHRAFEKNGKKYRIQVDLLTGGDSSSRSELAQAVHGCELAFEEPVETLTQGVFPDGHEAAVTLRVASIVSFISMKAIAFADRWDPKDAYDIYYCVRYYQPGLQLLAHQFKKWVGNPLVREGIDRLRENFAAIDARGPRAVSDFLGDYHDEGKRDRAARDAFERVNGVLQQI